MKKRGILNKDISSVIAGMGHCDTIVIGDAGLPIPVGPKRIDLAVQKNIPGFMEVLNVVVDEMEIQKVTVATEMKEESPELYKNIEKIFNEKNIKIDFVSHVIFKEKIKNSKAVIRTGEFTAYANIILESGVLF